MQPPPKAQAQKPDASPQDTEMTDEPRGCSPPCSQGTTFIHQATPLENQNFADLLAPKPSKGRLPKQAKQAVHFSTQKSERKSREPLPELHFQKPCQFSHHYLQIMKHSGRGEPPNHQTRLAIMHQKSQP